MRYPERVNLDLVRDLLKRDPDRLARLADQAGAAMNPPRAGSEILSELKRDWRVTCPRVDHLGRLCLDPDDPLERGADGFPDSYRVRGGQWWHGVVAGALERVTRHLLGLPGPSIGRLWVQLPLQHGKSLHAAELFPAHLLGVAPTLRIGAFGYNQGFAKRAISHAESIMSCARYREVMPGVVPGMPPGVSSRRRAEVRKLLPSTQEVFAVSYRGRLSRVAPTAPGLLTAATRGQRGRWRVGGYYVSGSWPKPPNGISLDCLVLDDPYRDWQDAYSQPYGERLWDSYVGTLERRLQSPMSAIVLCSTARAPGDINHRIVDHWRRQGKPYEVVTIPAWGREDTPWEREHEVDRSWDPRDRGLAAFDPESRRRVVMRRGGILDEAKPGAEEFYAELARLPARDRRASYELAPEAADSERFAKTWWSRHAVAPSSGPVLLSLDAADATKDGGNPGNSFAACGAWRRVEPELPDAKPWAARLGEYRGRPSHTTLCAEVLALARRFVGDDGRVPEGSTLLVESKAGGRALLGDRPFREACEAIGLRVIGTKEAEEPGPDGASLLPPGWSKGGKDEHWRMAEGYVKSGRASLPLEADWLETQPADGRAADERIGYLDELARGATPNDRIDETAQALVALFSDAWVVGGVFDFGSGEAW